MPRPTLRRAQKYLGGSPAQPRPDGQTALAAVRERNAEAARANGQLAISVGTAAIHPNTGIRKAHSVGCTQSMEHSSGMWYDGREFSSGTLENMDFEPVESPYGRPGGDLFMCYFEGELYADSEACYSDEDEDEEVLYDDDDEEDESTDGAATNEDDDDDSESPDELLYMHYCPDSKKGPAVEEHELDMDKLSFEKYSRMSSPVDARDLHGRLMLVQGQDCSS